MSSSGFPTLKREIAADESALKFLRDFGLKEPSMLSEVLHNIFPKYASSEIDVEGDENREDIHKMCRAMRESNQEDRALLIEKMGTMHFVLASDAIGDARYVRPVEAYISTPELEEYFEGNPDSYFLDEKYDEASVEFLCELGASKHVRIFRQESLFGVTTVVAGREHQRFQNGFDPNCMIDGLQYAFDNNTMSKAEYIWNHLLLPNIHLIRGVVESDTRQTFNSPNYRRAMHKSRMGEFVTTRAWLPDQEGVFYKSDELSLENLPDSFVRNEELASALAMRSPESKRAAEERAEVEAAARKLGISIEDTEWIRHNQDDFQLFKEDLERKRQREQTHSALQGDTIGHSLTGFVESLQAAFDKPNRYSALETQVSPGNVRNPALRRERTHEEIEQALLEEPARAQRFKRVDSQVWEAKDNTVRAFLREQYTGHCQICDKTFLKRDGEPYFEGLYLVSQTHARWVNRSGNVLCVCANCCAKFQHGAVEVDSIIEQIQAIRLLREGGEGKSSLRIRLCDKDVLIQFTEAHILDLQEIVRLSSNDA